MYEVVDAAGSSSSLLEVKPESTAVAVVACGSGTGVAYLRVSFPQSSDKHVSCLSEQVPISVVGFHSLNISAIRTGKCTVR